MNKNETESLPAGWAKSNVGNIFQIFGGGTPSTQNTSFWNGEVAWISSADISESHKIVPRRKVSDVAIASSTTNLVPKGSIVVVTRVGLGKVAMTLEPLCFSQDCHALLPNELFFYSSYVLLFMSVAVGSFKAHSRGTTISGVTRTQLEELGFLVPPLPEQHRIVEEIEKQFSRLDAAVAALKRVKTNLKRYRASVLKAASEGRLVPNEAELARKEGRAYEPADALLKRILVERRARWEADQLAKMTAQGRPPLNNAWKAKYQEPAAPEVSGLPELPEGWCWASLIQTCSSEPNSISDGPFGSNLKTSHYTSEGPRVIRLQNIGDGVFINAFANISQEHFNSLSKHQVEAGDLVIAALGERSPRACIIPTFVGQAIVKADCVKFKTNENLNAKYFNFTLNMENTKNMAKNIVHGVGRPRMNLGEIKAIPIPLPPIAEQERIVAEVERRLSIVEGVETTVNADLKRAERLRQSILQRAFSGKLVPQDPNDEPASVLLERIRAEREASAKEKAKKANPLRPKKSQKTLDMAE